MDIPGFYYCPIKKKYFKDSPELKRKRREEQERKVEQVKKKKDAASVQIFNREFLGISNKTIMDSITTKLSIKNTIEFPIVSDITAFHLFDSYCILGSYRSCLFYDTNKKESRVYNFDSQITSIQSYKSNSHYISISSLGTGVESGKTRLYIKNQELEFLNEIESRNSSPVWCSDLNRKMESVLGSIGKYSIVDWNRGVIIDFKIPKKTDILAIKSQNGLVYTGCRNGYLYILDSGYKPKYTINCNAPLSDLIVRSNSVYASMINGQIQEWDSAERLVRSGNDLWKHTIGLRVTFDVRIFSEMILVQKLGWELLIFTVKFLCSPADAVRILHTERYFVANPDSIKRK
ncbi:hypothetical protein HDV06_004680 [Boothiomyces sp. JEL0866]|nr:hypothetical protein HDV06_004680 [Boothiomyces sp. JEL0866]